MRKGVPNEPGVVLRHSSTAPAPHNTPYATGNTNPNLFRLTQKGVI
jgi:hypothetical protein